MDRRRRDGTRAAFAVGHGAGMTLVIAHQQVGRRTPVRAMRNAVIEAGNG
jgi:hypothetical protein